MCSDLIRLIRGLSAFFTLKTSRLGSIYNLSVLFSRTITTDWCEALFRALRRNSKEQEDNFVDFFKTIRPGFIDRNGFWGKSLHAASLNLALTFGANKQNLLERGPHNPTRAVKIKQVMVKKTEYWKAIFRKTDCQSLMRIPFSTYAIQNVMCGRAPNIMLTLITTSRAYRSILKA